MNTLIYLEVFSQLQSGSQIIPIQLKGNISNRLFMCQETYVKIHINPQTQCILPEAVPKIIIQVLYIPYILKATAPC